MSCREEAEGDGHDHHGHGGHSHSCGEAPDELSFGKSLFRYIDREHVQCLNEGAKDSGKRVFKSLAESKESEEAFVQSAAGESRELLLKVPLTDIVTLRSISVQLHCREQMPLKMKLWKDREEMDFGDCEELRADDDFDLVFADWRKTKYFTKVRHWSNTNHICILFTAESEDDDYDSDDDAEETAAIRIDGVYLFGEFRSVKRKAVATVYESKPLASDHKAKGQVGGQSSYIS